MFVSYSIKMSNFFLPWNREAGPEDRCWWLLSHKFYLVVSGVKSRCKQWGNQWRANLKRENHRNGRGVDFFDSRKMGGGGGAEGGGKRGEPIFPKRNWRGKVTLEDATQLFLQHHKKAWRKLGTKAFLYILALRMTCKVNSELVVSRSSC